MESLFSILQIDIRFNNLPRATYSIGLVYVGIYIAEVSKMLYIYWTQNTTIPWHE
jgi:hypothetical protein